MAPMDAASRAALHSFPVRGHAWAQGGNHMQFKGFQHINIRCAPQDLPAIEKFYGEVLGLKSGFRPGFSFPGCWLYDGDDPIVHVGARFPQGSFVKEKHSGSVDHIAWKASGAADFRRHLKRLGIAFQEQNVANAGYQVFIHDPVGTKLEFNFMNEFVEDAVPLGTELPRGYP
jgi:catechol 2,3-dioxygenase-like lactoylglutathione lyase family enzyme